MTPQEAREQLLARADSEWAWLGFRTTLEGGWLFRRAERRHQAEQDAAEARAAAEALTLRTIAALPDEDLQWLLDVGWRPAPVPGPGVWLD